MIQSKLRWIFFGFLLTNNLFSDGTEAWEGLATEVWDFEKGNNRTIAPTLKGGYSNGIALYTVGPFSCKIPDSDDEKTDTSDNSTDEYEYEEYEYEEYEEYDEYEE